MVAIVFNDCTQANNAAAINANRLQRWSQWLSLHNFSLPCLVSARSPTQCQRMRSSSHVSSCKTHLRKAWFANQLPLWPHGIDRFLTSDSIFLLQEQQATSKETDVQGNKQFDLQMVERNLKQQRGCATGRDGPRGTGNYRGRCCSCWYDNVT